MPLKLNVGLSRKLSKDYNSRGFSVNIDAELPATAIDEPETIADKADYLFRLVDDVLNAQVTAAANDNGSGDHPSANGGNTRVNGSSSRRTYARAGGQSSGNGESQQSDRPMTDAQKRALTNMARKVGTTAEKIAHEEFGLRVSELSLQEASQLIDQLKQEIEQPTAGSRSS